MGYLSYPEDSLQILRESENLSKQLGDRRSLARFYIGIGQFYSEKGDLLRGRKYYERSVQEAEKIQAIELLAPTIRGLCYSFIISGEFHKIVDLAPKAITLLENRRDEWEFDQSVSQQYAYSSLLAYYGFSIGACGNFEEGKRLLDKSLHFQIGSKNHCEKSVHLFSLAVIEFCYGFFYLFKGDGANLIKHWQNVIKIFEEAQYLYYLGLAWSGVGTGYYYLGDRDNALKYIEKGIKIQKNGGYSFGLSIPYWFLGSIYFELGDLEKAQRCAEESMELSQSNYEKFGEGGSKILFGRILGKRNLLQSSKAEESISQGIKILEALKLRPVVYQGYLFLGEIFSKAGQKEKALESLKKAKENFREMGMNYWLEKTQDLLKSF